MAALLGYLPRGESLSDAEFKARHTFVQWILLLHLPGLLIFGLARGFSVNECVEAIAGPAAFLVLSRILQGRRLSALAVTAGLSSASASLVVLSGGAIEAHFHFFVTIGLIALYQDWVPFAWNALFTVFSHGVGSALLPSAFFAHAAGQHHPWTWSVIHGIAVLAACAGTMIQMRFVENDHHRTEAMRVELLEGNQKRFTADLLVNLARRNQNLIYRQLELLNRLEDHERDAEQLSHLFQLDHLATRIRRNAESLLVLSGEEPARKWGGAVLLVDVVRAAIAEIEELDRVDFTVDESLRVSGRGVADATHLLAELIENAVHFSPPGLSVMVRTRPYLPEPGAQVLTIEDWGVGMSRADIDDANDLLENPREVDLATSQRLGLHVVARLAARYGIACSLDSTPGGGVTAVVVLPAALFTDADEKSRTPVAAGVGERRRSGGSVPPVGSGTPLGGSSNGTAAALAGSNGHGPGSNGHGPALAGSGSNGHGPGSNGHGSGSNGHGPALAGSGSNGHGPGSNGHGSDGHGAGLNGVGLNGTAHGAGLNGTAHGTGLNGTAHDSDLNGSGHGPDLLDTGRGPAMNGTGLAEPGLDSAPRNGSGLNGFDGPVPHRTPRNGLGPFGADGPGGTGTTGKPADRIPADLSDLAELEAELGSGVGYFGRPADGPLPTPRTDAPVPERGRDEWSQWWPLPAEGGSGPELPMPDGLARRTPQANLAAELRRDGAGEADRQVRTRRDPAETRSALSRFQATQRAAREGRQEPGLGGKENS